MKSDSPIASAVAEVVCHMRENRVAFISADCIAQAVLDEHPRIKGKDRDFYRSCAFVAVREEARKQANRFKLRPTMHPDKQLVLPGFERLQEYYAVEDDAGRSINTRIDLLSDEILLGKADDLDAMGSGCHEHAREIRNYVRNRNAFINRDAMTP